MELGGGKGFSAMARRLHQHVVLGWAVNVRRVKRVEAGCLFPRRLEKVVPNRG